MFFYIVKRICNLKVAYFEIIVFVIVFIFVFSKGIEVLTSPNPNSYSIPYDGPLKSAIEKWLPFSKDK